MPSKGVLAVSLFAVAILASNLATFPPTSFDWSHGAAVAGAPITVKVNGAPCHPVTVILYVDGVEVAVGTIPEVPGTVTFGVPVGSQGACYSIVVQCPSARDSDSGQVL